MKIFIVENFTYSIKAGVHMRDSADDELPLAKYHLYLIMLQSLVKGDVLKAKTRN